MLPSKACAGRAVVPGDGQAQPAGVGVGGSAEAHDRGAGAVGGLDLARAPAGVGEQRGVRVAHHGAHRRAVRQRREVAHARERPGRGDDVAAARRAGRRTGRAAPATQSRGAHVEQLRARGVAGLDHVARRRAVAAARVDGAEADARRAPGRRRAASAPWCAENIGSSGRPLSRAHRLVGSRRAARRSRRGPLVLPAEHRPERLARRAVPEQQRLALGAEADRGDAPRRRVSARRRPRPGRCAQISFGVLLDPAGPRVRRRDGRARRARRSRRARSTSTALVRCVPWSMARISRSGASLRSRAAAAMPSAVRPKWSSRKLALPVGANAGARRGCASAPGWCWATQARDRGAEAAGDDRLLGGDDARASRAPRRARVASSSGSTNGMLITRAADARRRAAGSAASSARETIVPIGDHRDVVAVASAGSRGRARTARRPAVTSGTLKRGDAQVQRAGRSSTAQRTAARVCAGSAGTTTSRSAIARSPGQVLDRVVRRAELAVGHARALAAEHDVVLAVGDVGLDLLERAAGQERRGGARRTGSARRWPGRRRRRRGPARRCRR